MKVSVVTPFTKAHEKFLAEAYASLEGQTLQEFEWVLLPNRGAVVPAFIAKDSRVKVIPFEQTTEVKERIPIGLLKRKCCEAALGDIIVEFDADDILLPTVLEKVVNRFENKDVIFVYSNNAYFRDETWASSRFGSKYGWKDRPFIYKDHELFENLNFRPTVHALRYVFWAPDHVRAWRASAYWAVGGHDVSLIVGDDHDLICRFYIAYGEKGFGHIDECLYLYRQHVENTCVKHNDEVQVQTDKNYIKHHRTMVKRWAEDEGLKLLDLGGRFNKWDGYLSVDNAPPADIITDLNKHWPFKEGSVGVIKAYHIFEHLRDPIHAMNEAFRVLAPGGWLLIEVPSTDGRGAFQDPTHKSFWNLNSFLYYTDRQWAQFIQPYFKGRFQVSRMVNFFPFDEWKSLDIPIVQADLIALKPPYSDRHVGEIKI